jgi:HSP20 family protein
MRRYLAVFAVMCLFLTGLSAAQTRVTEQEEKELEELSSRLVRMKRAVDKFADELTASYREKDGPRHGLLGSNVRVDILENEKEFVVKADLPGMDKDKIVVTLDNNRILKISGARQVYKTVEGPNVVRQERMEGSFERVIELPAECKSDGITAAYNNGVLEIVVPKKEAVKPETVNVTVR